MVTGSPEQAATEQREGPFASALLTTFRRFPAPDHRAYPTRHNDEYVHFTAVLREDRLG